MIIMIIVIIITITIIMTYVWTCQASTSTSTTITCIDRCEDGAIRLEWIKHPQSAHVQYKNAIDQTDTAPFHRSKQVLTKVHQTAKTTAR